MSNVQICSAVCFVVCVAQNEQQNPKDMLNKIRVKLW